MASARTVGRRRPRTFKYLKLLQGNMETKQIQIQAFDLKAKRVLDLQTRLDAMKERRVAVEQELKKEIEQLSELVDRGEVGKDYEAHYDIVRRSIGKPDEPELDALEIMDPRLVRRTSGNISISYSPNDMLNANVLIKELQKSGRNPVDTPPVRKPATMAAVEKVLKDRDDLSRKHKEVFELLDIQYKKELQVIPTIFGQ